MVKLERIHHIGYFTDDLEAAIRRYGETFPLDEVVRGESTTLRAKIAFLKSGQTWIEVMEPENRGIVLGKSGLILHHIAYEVDDIEAAVKELQGQGARFRPGVPTPGPAGPVAYFDDAQLGTTLHLIQPSAQFRLP